MSVISVIVPVYKVELYLRRCVDSILGQTFTDFELILVDDGSPDGCPAICDAYAQQDERVHVIHQQNGGLSAARNAGIDWAFANSDSQWLTFIDSDDWVHPEILERLLNAVCTDNVSVSICGFYETIDTPPVVLKGDYKTIIWTPEDYYVQHTVNATVAWGKLYKKDIFLSLRYPVGKIHEDEFTTYRILFAEHQLAVVPARMYYYFQNDESIMHRPFDQKRMVFFDALEEQIDYFEKEGFNKAQRFKIRIYLLVSHERLREIKLSFINLKQIYALQKKRMKGYCIYARKLNPLDDQEGWFLTQQFPKTMWLFWHWIALKEKMKNKLYHR